MTTTAGPAGAPIAGPDPDPAGTPGVLLRLDGHAARITLDRPRALNALDHAMVTAIARALDAWERDPRVAAVVLDGAGERGLCAGGDIRSIHADASSGGNASAAFWADEYRLNATIAAFPKPYVALMDGIVLGGGVGLSAHANTRIVTERSSVGMPETGIGFVPDVGGTYLLSRAPGELGTYLALTGLPVGAADAITCGLADHFVPAASLPALVADLASGDAADVVARYARTAPPGRLPADRAWIDRCFAAGTVEEILARLAAETAPGAAAAAEVLATRSPVALKVTLAAVRRARALPALADVLRQEYRVSCAALASADLVEGIRAQVIDKDRAPRWSPPTLAEVTDADVERYFAPLGDAELRLGVREA